MAMGDWGGGANYLSLYTNLYQKILLQQYEQT